MKIKLISESDKRFLFVFYVIVIIIFIYWSVFAFLAPRLNPMRREHAEVTNYILTITPIGMNIDDAINVIETNRHLGRVPTTSNAHLLVDFPPLFGGFSLRTSSALPQNLLNWR